jgi:uncharacterized protein CbrC (UPF0167 family)
MELPQFKYNPNAYKNGIFEKKEGTCSVCNEKRNVKYTSSFYSIKKPEYICPFCIANGKAAEKYDGEFVAYSNIEGVSPDPADPKPTIPKKMLLEVSQRTPCYNSWQQEVWLSHCNEPCVFIDYADGETIKPFIDELEEDIEGNGYNKEQLLEWLSKNGSVVGYLFQCLHCGKHRLHNDFDY